MTRAPLPYALPRALTFRLLATFARNCLGFILLTASAFADVPKPTPQPSAQPRLPFLRRYAQPAHRGTASTPPPQAKLPFLRRYAEPRSDIKITHEPPGTVHHAPERAPASRQYGKPQQHRGRTPPPLTNRARAPAAAAPPTAYSSSPSGSTNIKMAPLHPQLRNEKDTERTIRLDMTRRYLNR